MVLVQPNISLSAPNGGLFWGPQGPEVTRGHSLSIICSTGPQYQGGSFHLIFDGSNTTRTELAVNHSASFYIPEADYSHQGNYSCVYEVNVSRRAFKSTHTALLTIIIRRILETYIYICLFLSLACLFVGLLLFLIVLLVLCCYSLLFFFQHPWFPSLHPERFLGFSWCWWSLPSSAWWGKSAWVTPPRDTVVHRVSLKPSSHSSKILMKMSQFTQQ